MEARLHESKLVVQFSHSILPWDRCRFRICGASTALAA